MYKGSIGTSMSIISIGPKKKVKNKNLPIYLRIPKQIKKKHIIKYKHKKKTFNCCFDDMIPKISKNTNNFPF